MEDGTVLIVAGCLLGFVAGCLVCAEVFFACGARASAWAYRAGRREACEECRERFAEALKAQALGGSKEPEK